MSHILSVIHESYTISHTYESYSLSGRGELGEISYGNTNDDKESGYRPTTWRKINLANYFLTWRIYCNLVNSFLNLAKPV